MQWVHPTRVPRQNTHRGTTLIAMYRRSLHHHREVAQLQPDDTARRAQPHDVDQSPWDVCVETCPRLIHPAEQRGSGKVRPEICATVYQIDIGASDVHDE